MNQETEVDYYVMDEEDDLYGEWNETTTVNWMIFCSRVFSLLFVIALIVCLALTTITSRFIVLAGFALAAFILCFGLSWLECCKKRFSTTYVKNFSFSTNPNHTDEKGWNPVGEINA